MSIIRSPITTGMTRPVITSVLGSVVATAGPNNTAVPAITGTVAIGQTLTASSGTWEGTGVLSYAYQWRRNGSPIDGATASTYVVTAADALAVLTVQVIATDDDGPTSATSAGTIPVPGVAPNVIASDALSGRTLTITVGTLEGVPTPTVELTALTLDGVDVLTNATGTGPWSYAVASSTASQTVAWTVTATNGVDTDTSTGSETIAADLAVPAIAAAPTIAGTEEEGETLTATLGSVTGTPTPASTVQWERSGTPINGATSLTYLLTADDVGETLTVVHTATNSVGTDTAESLATGTIGEPAAIPVISGVPTIGGTATVGQTLTATAASVTGNPTPARTWAWERDGTPISGATASSYELVSADAGAVITVVQTETNSEGVDTAESTGTAAVTEAPGILTPPAITGTTEVGETLTAGLGEVTGTPTPTSTVQWERSGTAISGATSLTYTIVEADLGATLTVVHTATNSVGTVTAESAATATVTEASATPETISSFTVTDADATGDNDLTLTVSGATTAYVVAVPNAATAPSAAQVRAGQNAAGSAASVALNFAVSAGSNTETSINIPGGLQGQFDFYATVTGSSVVTSDLDVELDVVGPTLSSATGSAASATSITWGVTSNEAGGTVYAGARLAAATTALTAAQLIAGAGGDGLAWNSDATATADSANGGTLTGLTAETGYVVDMVQVDAHGNQSTVVTSGTITTSAAAGWTPASLSGASWYEIDPSTMNTQQDGLGAVPGDGDAVGLWQDKSANGIDLVLTGATYRAGGGTPYIELNGTTSYMESAVSAFSVDRPSCMTAMARTKSGAFQTVFGLPQVDGSHTTPFFRFLAGFNSSDRIGARINGFAQGNAVNDELPMNTDKVLYLSSGDDAIRVDGVEVLSGFTTAVITYPNAVPFLFGANGARAENLGAKVYGLIIRDGHFGADLADAETWCAAQYGGTL